MTFDPRSFVVHRREPHDVYVGRPSIWGNPFSHLPNSKAEFRVASREEAIQRFEAWIQTQPELIERAKKELRGKILGCWCAPQACHGEVLARIANEGAVVEESTQGFDPEALGARCSSCPLQGKTPVPPQTNPNPKLILIGEAPGRYEQKLGRPFVGPSGKMLDSCLSEAGMDRDECHVTNVILCAPDDDKEQKEATPCCAPRLARELGELSPAIPIQALGAKAAGALLGRAGIMRARGFIWHGAEVETKAAERSVAKLKGAKPSDRSVASLTKAIDSLEMRKLRQIVAGRVIIPTLHPAFILRGADGFLPLLRLDIGRAVRWAREGGFQLEDQGPFKNPKTPTEAKILLAKMSSLVTVDIETNGDDPIDIEITCVGIADINNLRRVVVIDPWRAKFGPVLAAALKHRTVVGHNLMAFDEIALAKHRVKITKREDTLISHHAAASHMPQSLAHVGSVYCSVSPWKITFRHSEEKGAVAGFSVARKEVAVYNASDLRVQALAWKRMQPDLSPERAVYEADMALAAVCQKMQIDGIRVDEDRRKELDKGLRYRASALLGEMRGLTKRRSFHPARLEHVRKALFRDFKTPLYLAKVSEKTGVPSTGVETLEKLRTGDNRAARLSDLILRWRAAAKVRGTFVELRSELHPSGIRVHSDGRVHPSWRAFGTVTGRLSCRKPNLQNLPRQSDAIEDQVRSIYIPARGHEFVYYDIRQSEMRAAALLSGDERFLASCESGDVHGANASILFPEAAHLFAPGAELTDAEKKLKTKLRNITKNAGFGILYLAETETIYLFLCSRGFDVTLDDVITMFDFIHATYETYYRYVDSNIELCAKKGFLRTAMLGRKRFMGYRPKPTEIANFMVQSFIADLINRRVVEMDRRLPRGCRLVAQIHDACIYECKSGKPARQMEELVRDVWAEPAPLESAEKKLVFPIDVKRGDRWGDLG